MPLFLMILNNIFNCKTNFKHIYVVLTLLLLPCQLIQVDISLYKEWSNDIFTNNVSVRKCPCPQMSLSANVLESSAVPRLHCLKMSEFINFCFINNSISIIKTRNICLQRKIHTYCATHCIFLPDNKYRFNYLD